MNKKTIIFTSQLDINLLKFRLPVMLDLQAKGWRVVAMVPKGNYSKQFEEHKFDTYWIPIKRRSINPFTEIQTIWKVFQGIKSIQPDIVHAFTIKPNIYATIISRLLGVKKIIASITGMGAIYSGTSPKARLMQFMLDTLYRLVGIFCHHIMFQNSDDLAYFIKNRMVKASKASCIKGSGIDTSSWSKNNNNVGFPIRFILIARLLRTKGILDYCEAARIIKSKYSDQASFYLLGDVDAGNPDSLKRSDIDPYISANDITFLGWVDDIKEQLNNNDVFVLPSYYREGIPRTGIEASSMSMPIITTNAIGCRELVDDNKNGILVSPKSPKELVSAMSLFVEKPDLIQSMGNESRQKAMQEFDISKIIDQYIQLYQK